MKLFFDIGNTNIKLKFNIFYFSLNTKSNYSIDTLFSKMPKEIKNICIEEIYICSTVPSATSLIEGMCKKYLGKAPKIIDNRFKKIIKISTDNPFEVGSDLIALGEFLNSRTNNGIIVNMGTSTTIIHVKNKDLKGVIICSGLMIQMNALINNVSKLSEVKLSIFDKNIGTNTVESISIGLLNGHSGMIKSLVNKIDPNAKKFISGGYSKKINSLLPEYEWIKEATIEGMQIMVDNEC